MNQLYRALHIPPKRLLRKAYRAKKRSTPSPCAPRPTAEGTRPAARAGRRPLHHAARAAPAAGSPTRCSTTGTASRWLYAEAMDLATGLGPSSRSASCTTTARQGSGSVALQEDFHLSFPTVFDWNGETWMIPETGSDHSLRHLPLQKFPRPSGSWCSALPWTPNSAIRFWSTAPPTS